MLASILRLVQANIGLLLITSSTFIFWQVETGPVLEKLIFGLVALVGTLFTTLFAIYVRKIDSFGKSLTDGLKDLREEHNNSIKGVLFEMEADRQLNNQRHDNNLLAHIMEMEVHNKNCAKEDRLDIQILFRSAPASSKIKQGKL